MIFSDFTAPYTVIGLSAFLISVLTFVSTQINSKKSASSTYVQTLENRIQILENQIKELTNTNTNLQLRNTTLLAENIELLRRLAKLAT